MSYKVQVITLKLCIYDIILIVLIIPYLGTDGRDYVPYVLCYLFDYSYG